MVGKVSRGDGGESIDPRIGLWGMETMANLSACSISSFNLWAGDTVASFSTLFLAAQSTGWFATSRVYALLDKD